MHTGVFIDVPKVTTGYLKVPFLVSVRGLFRDCFGAFVLNGNWVKAVYLVN